MSLLEEIRAMSPEEQAELGRILEDAKFKEEHQNVEVLQLGMHGPGYSHKLEKYIDEVLTPEEIYIHNHPIDQREYGYYETFASWGQPQERKYWSKKEIDEYNKEKKRIWLEEARKVFPNITLPDEETMRRIEQYKDFF